MMITSNFEFFHAQAPNGAEGLLEGCVGVDCGNQIMTPTRTGSTLRNTSFECFRLMTKKGATRIVWPKDLQTMPKYLSSTQKVCINQLETDC